RNRSAAGRIEDRPARKRLESRTPWIEDIFDNRFPGESATATRGDLGREAQPLRTPARRSSCATANNQRAHLANQRMRLYHDLDRRLRPARRDVRQMRIRCEIGQ